MPFLPHVSYRFIGATITRDRHHPVAWLAGDLLVQFRSAPGHARRRRLPFDIGHQIGSLNHFDLLSHPDVYAQLEHWLTATGAVPARLVEPGGFAGLGVPDRCGDRLDRHIGVAEQVNTNRDAST